MRLGASRLVGPVAVIAGIVLVIIGYQFQREPAIGVEPSHVTVFAPIDTTPASVASIPSPAKVVTAPSTLPVGEPEWVVVTSANGTRLVDTSLVPTARNAAEELVPPFGKAGWYAEAGWSRRKPGFPGPSVVVGHISHRSQPDVFYDLPKVRPGDVVTVKYSSGDKVSFRVTKSQAVKKDIATDLRSEVAKSIWQPSGNQSVIRLFTCDPQTTFVNSHYLGNWVVWGNKLLK